MKTEWKEAKKKVQAVDGTVASASALGSDHMTCAEFQRDLPLFIDSGGSGAQDDHLRTCAVCRDLVNDLRYIAEQAKLLIPMHDPSPNVWNEIEDQLKREGLVRPVPARRST